MSEQVIGADFRSGVPRKWYKIEGGIKLGEEIRNAVEREETELGEVIEDAAEQAGDKDSSRTIQKQEIREAIDITLPAENFNVYKLHFYDGNGEERELPSEVILTTKDPEDYTMEVFTVQEKSKTTERTEKTYDDRIDHLEVKHQIAQGQDHGYGHRDLSRENKLRLKDLDSLAGDILNGEEEEEWVLESDTGPWTSIMDPTPVDLYRIAPESQYIFDNPDIDDGLGIYMDNYRDMIDVIVNDYDKEHEGWEDVIKRNYGELAEHTEDISEQGLKGMIESFPDKMNELYESAIKTR